MTLIGYCLPSFFYLIRKKSKKVHRMGDKPIPELNDDKINLQSHKRSGWSLCRAARDRH
ncbi:hypothetical protein EMIT074MI3_11064 [Bacillus licheniformis]